LLTRGGSFLFKATGEQAISRRMSLEIPHLADQPKPFCNCFLSKTYSSTVGLALR